MPAKVLPEITPEEFQELLENAVGGISAGIAELTFAAGSKNSSNTKVLHKLKGIPAAVVAVCGGAPTFEQITINNAFGLTETEFEINAEVLKAFVAETKVKFFWIAVQKTQASGLEGPQGAAGAKGEVGPKGETGPKGEKGEPGAGFTKAELETIFVTLATIQTITALKKFTGGIEVEPDFNINGRTTIKTNATKTITAPGPVTLNLGASTLIACRTTAQENALLKKVNKSAETAEPGDGQIMILENRNEVGKGNITIEHIAEGLEVGEVGLFLISTGANFILEPSHTMTFRYALTAHRWRDIAFR